MKNRKDRKSFQINHPQLKGKRNNNQNLINSSLNSRHLLLKCSKTLENTAKQMHDFV